MFDRKKYFNEIGIKTWESGKNVTRGWINITCPFCGDHEYSGNNHCGVSPDEKYSCWICGEKGGVIKLIKQLEGCSWKTAFKTAEAFNVDSISDEIKISHPNKFKMPGGITKEILGVQKKYLIQRRYDPDKVSEIYNLYFGSTAGRWRFKIIAPIIINGQIVSFVAADPTRKMTSKYEKCPNELSVVSAGDCVYNIDNVIGKRVLIVEGLLDLWRFGPENVVATLGTKFTPDQIRILKNRGVEDYIIMFDSGDEATKRANDFGNHLACFVSSVEIVEPDSGDPDDFTDAEALMIKKDLMLI